MRIETDTDYYYDVVNVYNRLIDEAIKKFGNLSRASKAMSKNDSYLYSVEHIGSVNNLFKICKKLELNFPYILTGKHGTHPEINYDNLLKIYKQSKKAKPESMRTIICMLRKKKNNIKLATLFFFSDFFKVHPLKLI